MRLDFQVARATSRASKNRLKSTLKIKPPNFCRSLISLTRGVPLEKPAWQSQNDRIFTCMQKACSTKLGVRTPPHRLATNRTGNRLNECEYEENRQIEENWTWKSHKLAMKVTDEIFYFTKKTDQRRNENNKSMTALLSSGNWTRWAAIIRWLRRLYHND